MSFIKRTGLFFSVIGFCVAHGSAEVKKAPPPHKKKKEEKSNEKGVFVNLGKFSIPILKENDPVAFVGVEIVLEGTSLEAAQTLRDNGPKIFSSFFIELYILANILWGVEDAIDAAKLKKRLKLVCEKCLGVDLVKDVVLQKIYARKLKK